MDKLKIKLKDHEFIIYKKHTLVGMSLIFADRDFIMQDIERYENDVKTYMLKTIKKIEDNKEVPITLKDLENEDIFIALYTALKSNFVNGDFLGMLNSIKIEKF